MMKIFCDSCEKEITNESRGRVAVSARFSGDYVVCDTCAEKIMKMCGDSINKKKQEEQKKNYGEQIVSPPNQYGAYIGSPISISQIQRTQRME